MVARNKRNLERQVARNQPTRRNRLVVRGAVGADTTTIQYRAVGVTLTTDAVGESINQRLYCPGYSGSELTASGGLGVASFYSDGKFLPGTHMKWIPNVGFTTSGRCFVAFTTNPEVYTSWLGSTSINKLAIIRSMGNCVSFPVYQETTIHVPTTLRRRLFDVNQTLTASDVNVVDRSVQIFMLNTIVGAPASTSVGAFEYTDRLYLEGLTSAST